MTEYWWRSWHGAPMDPKWAAIAKRAGVEPIIVTAIAWAMMDYASQQEERGSVVGFDTETYSVWAGIEEQKVTAVIQAMTDKAVIVNGRFANWEKRQPKSDKKIEQVTEWRKKKKSVTGCYQTLPETTPDTESESDTESDTDTDTEEEVVNNDADNLTGDLGKLQTAFITASKLPAFGYSKRAIDAYNQLKEMGAKPDDLEQVVQQLRDKSFTITGPWSIVNPMRVHLAASAHPRRPPPIDPEDAKLQRQLASFNRPI